MELKSFLDQPQAHLSAGQAEIRDRGGLGSDGLSAWISKSVQCLTD
jgi:hypothetical protein